MIKDIIADYGQPIYQYVPTEEQLVKAKEALEDLADEYFVFQCKEANGGIIVYARYGKRLIANPWSTRYLIAHLIKNQK